MAAARRAPDWAAVGWEGKARVEGGWEPQTREVLGKAATVRVEQATVAPARQVRGIVAAVRERGPKLAAAAREEQATAAAAWEALVTRPLAGRAVAVGPRARGPVVTVRSQPVVEGSATAAAVMGKETGSPTAAEQVQAQAWAAWWAPTQALWSWHGPPHCTCRHDSAHKSMPQGVRLLVLSKTAPAPASTNQRVD